MKRTVTVMLLLAGVFPPMQAARRVTAAHFEQAVSSLRSKSDSDAAFLIADMQLTERLNEGRAARLKTMLAGDKSRQVLVAVADASEFEPPPPEELPTVPSPDLAAQKRIMGAVVDYVSKTVRQLPNFTAMRVTDYFADTPLVQQATVSIPYEPLHEVGHNSVPVVYRNGREVDEAETQRVKRGEGAQGLRSWGEFGPILSTVLVDAARSKLAFSRWEQGPGGLQAIFGYEVPKEKSQYIVNYCCIARQAATSFADSIPFREIVGYHGEMAVDPQTGSILRLSVMANLKNGSPVTRADMLVEYANVEIGGKSYICPVKAVSLTTAQMVQLSPGGYPLAHQVQPLKTMLNHVTFDEYHVFRSDSRMLTAANGEGEGETGGSEPKNAAGAKEGKEADGSNQAETSGSAAELTLPAPGSSGEGGQSEAAHPVEAGEAAVPPEPDRAEFTLADGAETPAEPSQLQIPPAASGFRLRTTSRLVDVGLVAYDKKGRPVTDLKQDELEIYDNGRRQEIRYCSRPGDAPAPVTSESAAAANPAAPPRTEYSNRELSVQPDSAARNHATILMVDGANLAWPDFQNARQEMLRFLKSLPAEERVGFYVLRSNGFQVLMEPSGDHDLLAKTLRAWMPTAQDLQRAQQEEQRNRQHIDWVAHSSDLAGLNGNDGKDPEQSYSGAGRVEASKHGADPQLRSMGSNPQRDVLIGLESVARHLATLPGHKSLVWISSDNVLANWENQAAAREEKGPNLLGPLNVRAWEALNESHVSIYPLDASQLEGGAVTADLQNRLVQVKMPSPADPTPPPPDPAGRYAAQMHQDLHGITPEFRDLAEATGGRALRRAGDLAGELNSIAEDGRTAYLLSFTPDTAADDSYHRISIKLKAKRNLTLRYRTGYLYEKEPATLKQRFEKTVWRPRDENEIGLTAAGDSAGGRASLKLTIAATDLEMTQGGNRWMDKLDIFLVERGESSAKVNGRTLALRLQPATYERVLREGITVDQPMPVKSQARSFRIVVVDENSGRMGSLTLPGGSGQ